MRHSLRNLVTGGILASSFVSGVYGQAEEVEQIIEQEDHLHEYPQPTTNILSRTAVDAIDGGSGDVTTQSLLTCNFNDAKAWRLKVAHENEPDGTNNYGVDVESEDIRLNFAYNDNNGFRDQIRGLATWKFGDRGFVGASLERLVDETKGSVFGGFALDLIHLHGTVATDGAFSVLAFPQMRDRHLGVGLGRNSEGGLVANASYNTEKVWSYVSIDEDLEAGLVIGDISPKDISVLYLNVTNSGINEIYDGDETFKFDTGRFEHFELPYAYLGLTPGSMGFGALFEEDEGDELKFLAGYRVGSIGMLEDIYLGGDVRHQFETDTWGAGLELGVMIGNDNGIGFDIRGRMDYDSFTDRPSYSIFGGVRIDL